MNTRHQQNPMIAVNAETVPAANAGTTPKTRCHKAQIVNGSGPHLTKETQALLRQRLSAAAFILLVGFSVFLVRHVVGILAGEPLHPVLLGFHILVVVVLSVCTQSLRQPRSMSTRQLRVAELIVFGLPAAFFLLLQHRYTLNDVGRGFLSTPLAFWLLLIFTYAMFIPNMRRRAALVVGIMALAPVLLVVGMALAYPAVGAEMTAADFMQHNLVMAIAAVAAVFGTHLINTLRREAFEARQLGQYRLISQIGAGGMGEVYLAEHRMLKRPCAIKLIRPEQAGDPHVLARFEREVRMTAQLSHWNTVEIFDYGRTDDGTFFYVMEYLPGLNLEDLLARQGGPLPAERIIYLLRQTCQALSEAHSIGLIHRDIKPGNIFVAQRGGQFDVVKLLDFGLVKPAAEIPSKRLTREGAISGTPLFMSPEQARGLAEIDARSDIYSLGAVAYTLLCNRPPFERTTALDVLIAHARDAVTPPSQLQADVPADLEAIILRCLEKNPEDRFADVDSLEQALADCESAGCWTASDAKCWWRENDETEQPEVEHDLNTRSMQIAGQLQCACVCA